jgi:hypothetical protein
VDAYRDLLARYNTADDDTVRITSSYLMILV